MKKTRTTEMSKVLMLIAALGAGLPATVSARTVQGVDFDAVPWATFCPGVAPVELRSDAGTCAVTHPASYRHAKWDGFGMGVKESKPNCKKLEKEYKRFTSPRAGTTSATKPTDRWGNCIGAFSRALEKRASESEHFVQPFEQWRRQYFAGYIQSEG